MDDQESEAIRTHLAGATVRHVSPIAELRSYKNEIEVTQEFLNIWVAPFYMKIKNIWAEQVAIFLSVKDRITPDIILQLLGDMNWRSRKTGAFFAAMMDQRQFIDVIGVHLLRSQMCFAGETYSRALAYFNTRESLDYLLRYLDHYLTRPDLRYDQLEVMQAVKYLDRINGTQHLDKYLPQWSASFYAMEIDTYSLERFISVIDAVQKISVPKAQQNSQMDKKKIIIDGNNFSDMEGFYDEIDRLITKDLDWKTGHNLAAFNDLLWGGFGVHDYEEPITLVWRNFAKSRSDFGREVTIAYLEDLIKRAHSNNHEYLTQEMEEVKAGRGETLYEMMIAIIKEHEHIDFEIEE